MICVNARVVHLHRHVQTGEVQVGVRRHRIRRHRDRLARQVVRRRAPVRRFQHLHARQLRQRDPVGGRPHPHQFAERRAIRRQDFAAQFFNFTFRRRRAAGEQAERQKGFRRQRLLLHRQTEQRGLHLEIRFIRQHRLHQRVARQFRRARRRQPDEIRIVRNIRNDFAARARQRRAERRADLATRLNDEGAGFAARAEVRGNLQVRLRVRFNQRVLQQNRVRRGGQLADGLGRVGQAEGQPVRAVGGTAGGGGRGHCRRRVRRRRCRSRAE